MRVVRSYVAGGPETLVLEDVAEPVAGAGEALISVRACGLNYPDLLSIQDRYQTRLPRPITPGIEVAGVIETVGSHVTAHRPGDRVMAWLHSGGLSEKVAVPAARCKPIPDHLSFVEAAAFQVTYGTAYFGLKERGGLKAGETLLVLGAAGGVGLAAVELASACGVRVIAAASSQDKLDLALRSGASAGLVYPGGPLDQEASRILAQSFKRICGGDGVDAVYDPVGGDYAEPALRTMAAGGRYLVVGFAAGVPRIPLNLPLLKSCQIVGVRYGPFREAGGPASERLLAELSGIVRDHALRPTICATFPIERSGEALALLSARAAKGKVVVTLERR